MAGVAGTRMGSSDLLSLAGGLEEGTLTLQPCMELVDDWVSVSELDIAHGLLGLLEHSQLRLEGGAIFSLGAWIRSVSQLPWAAWRCQVPPAISSKATCMAHRKASRNLQGCPCSVPCLALLVLLMRCLAVCSSV